MYEANVDDVGYRLVAIYTPVREDGVEGQPVSASTDPIAVGNLESHLMLILKFVLHITSSDFPFYLFIYFCQLFQCKHNCLLCISSLFFFFEV